MQPSKIIFLDIDGTLVDYELNLPSSAVEAIRRARINGHQVIICSGRSKAEIYPNIWEIGLDGYIGGNGSYIEYQGVPIYEQVIHPDDARRAVDWLEERQLGYYLEANSGLYANAHFLDRAATIFGENSPENRQKVRDAFPDMLYPNNLYRHDLNKISFRLNGREDYDDAVRDFPQFDVGLWSATGASDEFADFGQKGIHKAGAVDILLAHIGSQLKDTLAFGDADSDKTMLQHCAVGVAMGNAKESLKAIADYVTTDVQDDGLYRAFEHYHLI